MDKKLKHYLFSTIFSFAVLIGVLITSIFSFGWFSDNQIVSASGANVHSLRDVQASLPLKAYMFDEQDNTVKVVADLTESITLPAYDTVFTEKNVDSLVIYQFEAFGAKIAAQAPFEICLTLEDTSEFSSSYISSIITVKCALLPELQDETDDTIIYTTARDAFAEVTGKSFVREESGALVKDQTISFLIENYIILSEYPVLTVYLQISYNTDLVGLWLDENNVSITSDIVSNNEIELISDLDCFILK